MTIIDVPLKNNPYPIIVGKNILPKLGSYLKSLSIGGDAVIITHPSLYRRYGSVLKKTLDHNGFSVCVLTVPEGEKSKSVKTAFNLIEKIARRDVLKRMFIIAFGGGVIGDLAGFVAASYKRGIPYVQVPTSFLAQIDSAIGGKVAIDLSIGKNLVGAFYQPRCVYSDVALLSSLPLRQIKNGLAEAVKYGIISDSKLFDHIETYCQKLLKGDLNSLCHVVVRSSEIKAEVIAQDEKETKGIRTLLNFGHTFGHAIEAAGQYRRYQHGEAIALGMRIASNVSNKLGMLSRRDEERINGLLTQVGLPQKIKKLKATSILNMMKHDKKFITGKNRFVLVAKIGKVKVVEGLNPKMIREAVVALMDR